MIIYDLISDHLRSDQWSFAIWSLIIYDLISDHLRSDQWSFAIWSVIIYDLISDHWRSDQWSFAIWLVIICNLISYHWLKDKLTNEWTINIMRRNTAPIQPKPMQQTKWPLICWIIEFLTGVFCWTGIPNFRQGRKRNRLPGGVYRDDAPVLRAGGGWEDFISLQGLRSKR